MYAKTVYVGTKFEGFHRRKDAPGSVDFLRDFHRHLFGVKLVFPVTHGDRQVEFFTAKAELDEFLKAFAGWENRFNYSCEQVAELILDRFPAAVQCLVNEDEENGAMVTRAPTPGRVKAFIDTIEKEIDRGEETPPPSKTTRTRPFYGVEAEGPFRGTPTLFVPACCTDLCVHAAVTKVKRRHREGKLPDVRHAYVGAGNVPGVTRSLLRALENAGIPARNVVVEVPRCDDKVMQELTGLEAFVVSHHREDVFPEGGASARAHFWKVVSDTLVTWHQRDKMGMNYATSLDDPLFGQDTSVDDL